LQEGGLHFTHATWYADGVKLDLYVETDDKDLFENLFIRLSEIGYGADRTTGKGQFAFELDAGFDSAAWNGNGGQRLSLSLCSASNLEAFEGTWKPEVKHGRTWSGHGEQNPFKKPFFAFTEGSIFRRMPKTGYLLRGIHSNPGIVQVTWPVTVPVKVEDRHAD
jgi:CRISPR-associated protein Csm4